MSGEFNFELEIRQDEERIARYFNHLPFLLDLPGENEAVLERVAMSAGGKNIPVLSMDELRRTTPGWEYDDEEEDMAAIRCAQALAYSEEYEMLSFLDDISLYYAGCFALCTDENTSKHYLALLCQCGKTLVRISDLLYTPESDGAMRSAIGKRALRDINDFAAMIGELKNTEHCKMVDRELDILQKIRKKVLDMLFKCHGE